MYSTRGAAVQAKAEMRLQLLAEAEQEQKANATSTTLALLCDAYVLDLEARGKAADSIIRAKDTQKHLRRFSGRGCRSRSAR